MVEIFVIRVVAFAAYNCKLCERDWEFEMLKRKLTELSNVPKALTKTKVPVPAIVLALGIVIVTANLDWFGSLEPLTCPLRLIWFCTRELK